MLRTLSKGLRWTGRSNGASGRLVRFFRALVGWMPGGIAVMVAAVADVFRRLRALLRADGVETS